MTALVLVSLLLAPIAPPAPAARPQLIGHRGLRYHAPEETLAGYAAAIELRVGIEVHVRRTRDGKLVAMHDAELARTTDAKGHVNERALAELKRLDAGTWFDPAFAGERVPTLEEVFGLVKQRRSAAFILAHIEAEGAEGEVARLAAKHGVAAQVICAGRPARDADARRKLTGKVGRAVLAAGAQDLPAALVEPDADWVLVSYAPSAADVVRAHKAGRRVVMGGGAIVSYDPEVCRQAFEGQVDALLTDFPLECRALWRSIGRQR